MPTRILLAQVLTLVLITLNPSLVATASPLLPAGVASVVLFSSSLPFSIAAARQQQSGNEQSRKKFNAYAGVRKKRLTPDRGRTQGTSAIGTGSEPIARAPRVVPRRRFQRETTSTSSRTVDAGGRLHKNTPRAAATSSFTTAFETALQDAFQSIQVGDEAACRKKAATLLDILNAAIGEHDKRRGEHHHAAAAGDSEVHKGQQQVGSSSLTKEPFRVDPTWSVPLTLGVAQGGGGEARKRGAPIKIVLSVGGVLMDAYTSFPTVPEFREVLIKLLELGLDPNTVTPWMVTQTLPLLWRALIHHRYDITLFRALLAAAAGNNVATMTAANGSDVVSNSSVAPPPPPPQQRSSSSWFGSSIVVQEKEVASATAAVPEARQEGGLSPLHLLLFPQETTDSTMKFLFEANKRLQRALGNDDVEVTTDRLRFPGDVIHEFDGLEAVSPTFRSLQQVMSEMSLATSSKISEEVALAHYSMWLSGPDAAAAAAASSSRQWSSSSNNSTRTGTPLCDVALPLASNGWNAFHILAVKGWHRLLKKMRLDMMMVAPRNLTCTSNPSRRLHTEIASALAQVGWPRRRPRRRRPCDRVIV